MSDPASPLSCQVRLYVKDDQALAVLDGTLRMNISEQIKQTLLRAMEPPVQCLNLYLGSLRELDSAGLGVLVGIHMTSRKNKQDLRILAPSSYHMGLFETTRLTKLLAILTGVEAEEIRLELEKPEYEMDAGQIGDA